MTAVIGLSNLDRAATARSTKSWQCTRGVQRHVAIGEQRESKPGEDGPNPLRACW